MISVHTASRSTLAPFGPLLQQRRRAEQARISVGTTAYLLGVSTRLLKARRVPRRHPAVEVPGQGDGRHLDEQAAAFRNRPADHGPCAFVWVDTLTQTVREGGRVINVHALIAVGVDTDGHREIPGMDIATAEDGAGWLAFPALTDRPRPVRRPAGHLRRPLPTWATPIGAVLPGLGLLIAPMPTNMRGAWWHAGTPAAGGTGERSGCDQ
ncbi:transposase [Streptomyces sp. NPDC093982]|uniref:transposase n=1 Tax=Streptomyces sp. NPDC093982 TaxID=3155077 RepID=UPI00342D7223